MESDDVMHGGKAIQKRRLRMKLTIDELSERTSIHMRELQDYERDVIGIPPRHFLKLAEAFDVHYLELSWECMQAAAPEFARSAEGRRLHELSNSLIQELRAERNGHTNGKVPKTPKRKANKPKAIA